VKKRGLEYEMKHDDKVSL